MGTPHLECGVFLFLGWARRRSLFVGVRSGWSGCSEGAGDGVCASVRRGLERVVVSVQICVRAKN